MARILSIDYGKKRTGLAVTDPLQIIANGLETVLTVDLKDWLFNYITEQEVERVLIGYPRHPDGNPTNLVPLIEKLKERLQCCFNFTKLFRKQTIRMILPIYAYGHPVLNKKTKLIEPEYPDFEKLLEDMWETMYEAQGVGLAAPQVGKSLRLFLVDTVQIMDEGKEDEGIKQAFINAEKLEEGGEPWDYEEGCLSIPDIRADVERPAQIKLRYQDENFKTHEKVFTGMNARVIQHEYDHVEGILFTQHLRPLKKRLMKRRLERIKTGKIDPNYRMKFHVKR